MSENYRPDLSEFGVVIPPEPLPGASALRTYLAEQTRDPASEAIPEPLDVPPGHWGPA